MDRNRRLAAVGWFLLLAPALSAQPRSEAQPPSPASSSYLPLRPGARWVLRSSAIATPVIFEVLRQSDEGYTLRSTNPWGMSEWTLAESGGQYLMTAYGTGSPLMGLKDKPLYLDFNRPAGDKWSNRLGEVQLVSRSAIVQSKIRTYRDCIEIRHRAGNTDLLYRFAKGVGYVQFGEGASAFVIDEAASVLPYAPVPPAGPETANPSRVPPPPTPAQAAPREGALLLGITPNRFANEPMSFDVMMRRFRQTLDVGVSFLVGNGVWTELEPREGQYTLGSINQLLSAAGIGDLPVSYALRVIDNRRKVVPNDLMSRPWSDPALRARLLSLLDQAVPLMKARVRWLMVGYEADAYFREHPGEVRDFLDLYRAAAARIRQLAPGIQVSCTIEFAFARELQGSLSELNRQLDFVALTYSPLQPDFTVKDPSVVPADLAEMKRVAAGRKIVLQEIGYPTSAANRSSEAKQAQFYREVFREFERDPGGFAAVNFMTLADLSDQEAGQYASALGLKTPAFKGALGTMGLFDQRGQPKESWKIMQAAAAALRNQK